MHEERATGRQKHHIPGGPSAEPAHGAVKYPGLGVMVLAWTAAGALASIRHYFFTPSRFITVDLVSFVAYVACFYPGIVLTPIVFRLEGRYPLGGARWPRHLAVLAALSVPVCLLVAPLMIACYLSPLYLFGDAHGKAPLGMLLLLDLPVAGTMFWSSAAAGYVIRTRFELREQERRAASLALERAQLEAGLKQAQLEVLRSKLNPHFLFNSLQNISVMTRENPSVASSMLARLGDLLRAVLRQDSSPETTLQEEVALTTSYVELEQMRFGDRLDVRFDLAEGVLQALVPCFVLQPLVENAIVHGLRGARRTGVIVVSAASDSGDLVLTVADNGVGLPASGSGIKVGVGLGSTCERLAKMYGDRQAFSIGPSPEGGTTISITIPLRFTSGEEPLHGDDHLSTADR